MKILLILSLFLLVSCTSKNIPIFTENDLSRFERIDRVIGCEQAYIHFSNELYKNRKDFMEHANLLTDNYCKGLSK